MVILGLKSSIYIFFHFLLIKWSFHDLCFLLFFHVFVTILLRCVVCIGFLQLIMTGISILDDLNVLFVLFFNEFDYVSQSDLFLV